jgi:hypothetical protein
VTLGAHLPTGPGIGVCFDCGGYGPVEEVVLTWYRGRRGDSVMAPDFCPRHAETQRREQERRDRRHARPVARLN